MTRLLSEQEFEERYGPTDAPDGTTLWEYSQLPPGTDFRLVWTVVDSDVSERMIALPGYHAVNVVGYSVCQRPWAAGDILDLSAVWAEAVGEAHHEIVVRVNVTEAHERFSDADLLDAVRSTLHEVFPTEDGYPVQPTVDLVPETAFPSDDPAWICAKEDGWHVGWGERPDPCPYCGSETRAYGDQEPTRRERAAALLSDADIDGILDQAD